MPTRTRPADDQLLTEDDLAELVRVSPRTVRRWRQKRTGPRVVRVMGSPRYWRSDVVRWVEEQSESEARSVSGPSL
jgi:DNA-binding transcriptional MerR regulator